jgi:site-specific recombinase XerD
MPTTLADSYTAALRFRKLSERTIEGYLFDLRTIEKIVCKPFTIDPDQILTAGDVWAAIESRPDLSEATLHRWVAASRSWHKWGNSRDLWPLNGIMSMQVARVTRTVREPLKSHEAQWLIDHATTPVLKRLILLPLFQGCRISGAARIDRSSFRDSRDPDPGFIGTGPRLHFFEKGKWGEVPLHEVVARDLEAILSVEVTRRQLRWHAEKMKRWTPFEWCPHKLRATYCQTLMNNRERGEVTDALMRHAPKSTALAHYGKTPWAMLVEAQGRVHYRHEQQSLF